jgi:hypothetical protein
VQIFVDNCYSTDSTQLTNVKVEAYDLTLNVNEVIADPPLSGFVQIILTFRPLIDVVGATGYAGI